MSEKFETIIIGGGQAGLATGYFLSQKSRDHIILEQAAQAGNAWRNDRWDSFTLVTPNWTFHLPGAEYDGSQPDGYMGREEIVARFEQYIDRCHLPVRYQAQAKAVEGKADGQGFRVEVQEAVLEAKNVVVATGLFQRPKMPSFSANLPVKITQLHSGHYRNPAVLPPGAVLVVGSAQSGCQIAEELYQSGRKVFLCVGSAGRAPRRYRGKDIFEWLYLTGFFDRTVDKLPSPKAKFAGNPHATGRDGGHTLNLHQFSRDGVTLLGRIQGATGSSIYLANDLKESLAKVDQFEAEIVKLVDNFILQKGLEVPQETLAALRDGYATEEITELDLQAVGITTIIWAMGYSFDFNYVKHPIFDSDGYPIQTRGVTELPGLYFVGLPWLTKYKSGLLVGVGEDAEFVASAIAT